MRGADAVLHLATRIPPLTQAHKPSAWRENDRIRREGTRNLVDATLAAGVATFIYPGVCFVYPDSGAAWIDAATTLPRPIADALDSTLNAEAEVARFSAGDGRGIVLRMGLFYGPDPNTGELLRYARRGIALVFGDPDAYQASIWVDDAAEAVVASLDARVPAGTYDVVDDEPLRRREIVDALARAVGRRRLWRVPMVVPRMLAGEAAKIAALSLRVSNHRFREASGWAPRVPSAREGWQRLAVERAGRPEHASEGATRRPGAADARPRSRPRGGRGAAAGGRTARGTGPEG